MSSKIEDNVNIESLPRAMNNKAHEPRYVRGSYGLERAVQK
jgi:hypothetical protein